MSKPVAAAAAVATDRPRPSITLSSHNADTVNAVQFVQLLDLFLADTDDELLTRQLMTFVCEGFVLSRDERAARRQEVTRCLQLIRLDFRFHYPRRARSASAWILFSLWMYVCMYVCYRSRKKTLNQNDLKLGTVVLLNSPPKPIDFVPNRFRGKGVSGGKRNLGPPQYLCIG